MNNDIRVRVLIHEHLHLGIDDRLEGLICTYMDRTRTGRIVPRDIARLFDIRTPERNGHQHDHHP
jgi:hypothetical protein